MEEYNDSILLENMGEMGILIMEEQEKVHRLFVQSIINSSSAYMVHYYRYAYGFAEHPSKLFNRNLEKDSKLYKVLPNNSDWLSLSSEKKSLILQMVLNYRSYDILGKNIEAIPIIAKPSSPLAGCITDIARRMLGTLPLYETNDPNEFIIEALSSLHVFTIPKGWGNMAPKDKKSYIIRFLINIGYAQVGIAKAMAKYYFHILPEYHTCDIKDKSKEDKLIEGISNLLQ